MGQNVAQKLIGSHLADGEMTAGSEIGLRIDQTLTQDATGTMVMLELEALGLEPGPQPAVGPVRRSQPASGRRAEHGRSPVPALGLPAVRGLVLPGSSANPGLRDFAVLAAITRGHQAHPQVSMDVNPTSRQILADLTAMGGTLSLIKSGARIHQAGCMGCIGMGQAPAIGRNSLRTVPRNFPGRSGTDEDSVWLCSPETAAAAALTGQITDPRDLPSRLGIGYPSLALPPRSGNGETPLEAPLAEADARQVELVKAPSIGTLPDFDELPAGLRAPVAIKVGDNISTDEILPAGARVLPFRSDIARLAEVTFSQVDQDYVARAREAGTHAIIAGENYGQGSSREHAVIAPRYLGLRLVIAKSYARIHWQNLANFGVLAVEFADPADYDRIEAGDELSVDGLTDALGAGDELTVRDQTKNTDVTVRHRLSPRQVAMVLAGGQIALVRGRPET